MFSYCRYLTSMGSVLFPSTVEAGDMNICRVLTLDYIDGVSWSLPNIPIAIALSSRAIQSYSDLYNGVCSSIDDSTLRGVCANNHYYQCSNWLPNGTYPPTWTGGAPTGDNAYGCSNIHQAPWFDNIYWSC